MRSFLKFLFRLYSKFRTGKVCYTQRATADALQAPSFEQILAKAQHRAAQRRAAQRATREQQRGDELMYFGRKLWAGHRTAWIVAVLIWVMPIVASMYGILTLERSLFGPRELPFLDISLANRNTIKGYKHFLAVMEHVHGKDEDTTRTIKA